jgi:two-component system cell cycle sensor histidine kinase PleC
MADASESNRPRLVWNRAAKSDPGPGALAWLAETTSESRAAKPERTEATVLGDGPVSMSFEGGGAQRLFAHLSHEIRTPLNAILGYAEIMEAGYAGPLSESQRTYLRNIRTAGTGLMRELEDLLDLAAIRSGNFPIDVSACDLGAVVVEALALTRSLGAEKDLDIRIGRCEATALADKRAFVLAMANAIGAACRAATYRDTVSIESESREDRVFVVIRGGGTPFPDTLISDVEQGRFLAEEPFRREPDRQIGMRLDLPIAFGLMRLQGGTVRIAQGRAFGCEITIDVPESPPISSASMNAAHRPPA